MRGGREPMSSIEEQLGGIMAKFEQNLNDETGEAGKRIAKDCAAEIRRTSPRDRPQYYKFWAYKAIQGFGKSVTYVIFNRKYSGLTHLLEKGHGNAKAKPHIKPAEEKFVRLYLEEMERAVKNAGD